MSKVPPSPDSAIGTSEDLSLNEDIDTTKTSNVIDLNKETSVNNEISNADDECNADKIENTDTDSENLNDEEIEDEDTDEEDLEIDKSETVVTGSIQFPIKNDSSEQDKILIEENNLQSSKRTPADSKDAIKVNITQQEHISDTNTENKATENSTEEENVETTFEAGQFHNFWRFFFSLQFHLS